MQYDQSNLIIKREVPCLNELSAVEQGRALHGSPILQDVSFGYRYDRNHSYNAVIDTGADLNCMDYNI